MMSNPIPCFDNLRAEILQAQWQADRVARQPVPFRELWRGCFGLAAIFDNTERVVEHAGRMLHPNSSVRWVAVRDVPPGHFHDPAMARREVHWASVTKALLRNGAPALDFVHNVERAWDFRFQPSTKSNPGFGRNDVLDPASHVREFAVLNRVSQEMTRYAFHAVDSQKRPVRPAWAQASRTTDAPFQPQNHDAWLPKPYVGFHPCYAEQMFWAVTESQQQATMTCPTCYRRQPMTSLKKLRFFEGGDFVAMCPMCQTERKYFLADAEPARIRRRFSPAFRAGFCRDLTNGLPLYAPSPLRYFGSEPDANMVVHRFRNEFNGDELVLPLHFKSKLLINGPRVEAGELLAEALPCRPSAAWVEADDDTRWNTLSDVLGGNRLVPFYQRQWFEFQGFQLQDAGIQWFWPSDLLASCSLSQHSQSLWWDFARCENYIHNDVVAAVFPPVPLRRWDHLKLTLGPVDVTADIGDDRFSRNPVRMTTVPSKKTRT